MPILTRNALGSCVDSIIVDLPFGNKCGSHSKNERTYHRMLDEMHRVLRRGGCAVLLTRERPLMLGLLNNSSAFFLTSRSMPTVSAEHPCRP